MIFWKNYKKLDKDTEVKPYLIGITKNLIYKKYREYSTNLNNIELYENDINYNLNLEELVENKEKSTKDLIESEFAETSLSAKLLKALIDEPKEAQLAYELLNALKEGK